MRAMVLRAFGGPEQFEAREVPDPVAGAGELLVRVEATSVNPVDVKIRQGGAWAGVKPPAILGYDAAGVVQAVGPGVRWFRPGDRVYYTPEIFGGRPGTYAALHAVPEDIVATMPANLSFEHAACVPLAGGTAYEAVLVRLALRPGETVLIHGGAGGVGHFAVQLAKACGARVLATAGPHNQTFLASLGVDRPIDYTREDFVAVAAQENGELGVDAVLDTVGGDLLARSVACTRPGGRHAGIVALQGDHFGGASLRNLTLHAIFLTRRRDRLEALRTLIERGQLRPHVEMTMPVERVAEAHRRLETGHGRGKVALHVAPTPPVEGDSRAVL